MPSGLGPTFPYLHLSKVIHHSISLVATSSTAEEHLANYRKGDARGDKAHGALLRSSELSVKLTLDEPVTAICTTSYHSLHGHGTPRQLISLHQLRTARAPPQTWLSSTAYTSSASPSPLTGRIMTNIWLEPTVRTIALLSAPILLKARVQRLVSTLACVRKSSSLKKHKSTLNIPELTWKRNPW